MKTRTRKAEREEGMRSDVSGIAGVRSLLYCGLLSRRWHREGDAECGVVSEVCVCSMSVVES